MVEQGVIFVSHVNVHSDENGLNLEVHPAGCLEVRLLEVHRFTESVTINALLGRCRD